MEEEEEEEEVEEEVEDEVKEEEAFGLTLVSDCSNPLICCMSLCRASLCWSMSDCWSP